MKNYVCPRCYGLLAMPDELPGVATCPDCDGDFYVEQRDTGIVRVDPLHSTDWEPPIEDFMEAVLGSEDMPIEKKLYWLVDSWKEHKHRSELLAEILVELLKKPVPPESVEENCWCGGYGTHYEICENSPTLAKADKAVKANG